MEGERRKEKKKGIDESMQNERKGVEGNTEKAREIEKRGKGKVSLCMIIICKKT